MKEVGSHYFFFFNDTATTEIYTLSLHDALPICTAPFFGAVPIVSAAAAAVNRRARAGGGSRPAAPPARPRWRRSEEHTSELQSRQYLVCRLLLEKKKKQNMVLHLSPPTFVPHSL